MKKTFILSAVAISAMLGACNNSSSTNEGKTSQADTVKTQPAVNNFDTAALKTGDVFYQCPMHPEEISATTGTCSKCGMDLEKMKKN